MSYMEIYNEEINDLLAPEHRKLQIHENIEVILILFSFFGWSFHSFGGIFVLLDILYNFSLKSQRGIYVAGLREEIVTSPEQVLDLMEFGECNFNFFHFSCVLLLSPLSVFVLLKFRSLILSDHLNTRMHICYFAFNSLFGLSNCYYFYKTNFFLPLLNLYQLIDTLERQIWICTVVDPILFFAW